jgi:urease accessory protein UreE
MRLQRRHGWLLLVIAAWNVVIWLTFAKNLYAAHADGEDRATAYWVAHSVLIVVDLVIAAVLTRLGLRVLRSREPVAPDERHSS